jgi:hypothetical protein
MLKAGHHPELAKDPARSGRALKGSEIEAGGEKK